MAHIDYFLRDMAKEHPCGTYPFLMCVTDPTFDPSTIPDLEVIAKLNSIWACQGTKKTLDALEKCDKVSSLDASR